MDFFICYSRSTQDKVLEIVKSLRDSGEKVWWDQDLRAGQDWWGTILNNIEACQVCIFFVSEKSAQSIYCLEELRYALNRNRLVLPFVIDAPFTYTIPQEIMSGRIQYESYSGIPNYLKDRILNTCKSVDWRQYEDRFHARPPEPNTGSGDLVDRLDQAISLANEGHFDEAVKGFKNVIGNDFASFGSFCNGWIEKINRYKEIANFANRPTMRDLAKPKWQAFLKQYVSDEMFDPLNLQDKLAPKDSISMPVLLEPIHPVSLVEGMTAEQYFMRGFNRPTYNSNYNPKIEDFSKAIGLKPEYIDAYYERGRSYHEQKKYDEAIADFNKVISLKPEYAGAYHGRGRSYHKQKKYDEAIADFTHAIKLNPQHAEAYFDRGVSYDTKRRYNEAIADFTRAIKLNPQHAEAYYRRGMSHKKKKDYDLAIVDYDLANGIGKGHALALENRRIVLEAKKKETKRKPGR